MLSREVREFIKKKFVVVADTDMEETVLTDGRSGAEVYRIKIRSQRGRLSGNYIVKVCNAGQTGETTEADKAALLYGEVPQFQKYLVKVAAESRIGDKNVIIYHQANDSVRGTAAFSDLDGKSLAGYARRVSYDLLDCMNKEYCTQTKDTAGDFFSCLSGKQIGETGRFAGRVENLLSNPDAECVVLQGVVYPNPLYFIRNTNEFDKCLSGQIFMKGVVHGDLHGFNLLAADNTYSVIDYDSVSMDSYLFFDHAYFEFSIFYDNLKDNDLKSWSSLLDCLIAPSLLQEAESCEGYKEYLVRNAVCGGIADWIQDRSLEKLTDDIEIQFILARIAAAINFFCKRSCTGTGKQLKVLFYIAYCFKLLFKKTGFEYDENDISSLRISSDIDLAELWEGVVKYTNYVPVLITDDTYSPDSSGQLNALHRIDWKMVVDIGLERKSRVVFKYFLGSKTRTVRDINMAAGAKVETFNHTTNILSCRKSEESSYPGLWRGFRKGGMAALKKLVSENPQIPLLFVFDCSRDSLAFRNQWINSVCDSRLPGGTRFVSLRAPFSEELHEEIGELEHRHGWHFVEQIGADLLHVAQTCNMYLNEKDTVEHFANLPSLNGVYRFSEQDLNSFASCIELVYSGCEFCEEEQTRFGLSGGDSLGEAFYKGNEATWKDIANHRDVLLFEDKKYEKILDDLQMLIEEKSPRVKTTELHHGAGTGGTTFSKRILWDCKDKVPCARLKKYTPKTADYLLEIYQKTGKSVLLSVESGSTVITEEELSKLKKEIDANNGKLVILLVKRTDSNRDSGQKKKKNDLPPLPDTMPTEVATRFLNTFAPYALRRENGEDRREWLKRITGVDEYKEQRSPFFYGFYAFQEEYQLINRLSSTLADCNDCQKRLLNSLALVTAFSQNVCVAVSELCLILEQEAEEQSIYTLMEQLPSAISKLTVIRGNGFRLCHKVIAQEILLMLHNPTGNYSRFEEVVFEASRDYIQMMSELYDSDNEYVNSILKELIIDRAYIDSEERKTRFSILVESIPFWTDRKNLFDILIEKFPDNPHYYNHLARLLATGDKEHDISPQYEKAVESANKAIEIAGTAKSIHETTLACIYGQWIINDIREETKNKKQGRWSSGYAGLITDFSVRYKLSRSLFEEARKNVEVPDSFHYFPQINMECEIINKLIGFDLERSLGKLLQTELEFKKWYDEHFSIATELYIVMKEKLGDNAMFLAEAKYKINDIAENGLQGLDQQFSALLESDRPSARRRSRSLAYTVFSVNGCHWNALESKTFGLAERCFRKNLMERDADHGSSDIETWLELYRRVPYFDAAEAQSVIADYMEDGYRKEYLLFLMTFLMHKDGGASASAQSVIRLIGETNRLACLHGLNTARERDVYVGSAHGVVGCPIVSMSEVDRDENKEPINLESFKGIVTEVEQTHGKIFIETLNLDVTFTPKLTSLKEEEKKVFEREDKGCPVTFNLMFSYSGLRGWNVTKI